MYIYMHISFFLTPSFDLNQDVMFTWNTRKLVNISISPSPKHDDNSRLLMFSDHLHAGVSDSSTNQPSNEHGLVCSRMNSAGFIFSIWSLAIKNKSNNTNYAHHHYYHLSYFLLICLFVCFTDLLQLTYKTWISIQFWMENRQDAYVHNI